MLSVGRCDAPREKLLVLELWGLGDLTFSTPLLRAAVQKYDVTLVGKPHAKPLLEATFPDIRFLSYDAPWSAYRGKYRLWEWNWAHLLQLVATLRRTEFDAAVSVRNDPRDHFLMWLAGAKKRFGFPWRSSARLLSHPVRRTQAKQHRVEDWRDVAAALCPGEVHDAEPRLKHAAYASPRVGALLDGIQKPLVALHPGARIPVRRWPEAYFEKIVRRMRERFDFHLLLIADPDGYGLGLAPLADTVLPPLAVNELVDVMGRVDFLFCNDSGPGHLAASCGRPAVVVFGPTDPDWFRPWGDGHLLVIRDICPWRPCFDYCKFREPYCMTKMPPEAAWHDIREHLDDLIARGVLPQSLVRRATA